MKLITRGIDKGFHCTSWYTQLSKMWSLIGRRQRKYRNKKKTNMHVIHIDDKHNFRLSYNDQESLRISFNIELELRAGTNSLLLIRSACIGGVGVDGVAPVVARAPACSPPPTAAPTTFAAAGVLATAPPPPTAAAGAPPALASVADAVAALDVGDPSNCLPILSNVGRVWVFGCGCDSCSKNCTKACSKLSLPGRDGVQD